MARSRTSQLIMELLDRVTGPARGAANSLRGLNRTVKDSTGVNVTMADRIAAAQVRTAGALDRARVGMLETIGTYYLLRDAVAAPFRAAAAFETQLEDIGQKANIPTERLAALGEQIKAVARETNQASSSIAASVDALVGRGAGEDVALAAAAPIGKAATAYRASTEDLASAAWAAVDNLKVPASQIGTALDMMAQAGKEGAFELRDMAQYFPALGASYQALGQEGVSAVADLSAAMQVVRKGTGDSSSAATNLGNVLQKIYAPATVRAFAKKGVDVFKEMEKAAERGLTPIEAIAELTDETLGGDLSKLGTLFEDAQVQSGLRALIQNKDEYRRIRDEALKAQGVVDADYERRVRTAAGATERWRATMENLNITLGTALLPLLNDIVDKLIPIIQKIGEWVQANPELTRTILASVGAIIALRGAISAITFVWLLGKSGALAMAAAGFKLLGAEALASATAVETATARQMAAMGSILGMAAPFAAAAALGVVAAKARELEPDMADRVLKSADDDIQKLRLESAEASLAAAAKIPELRAKQDELLSKIEEQGAEFSDGFDAASMELSRQLAEVQAELERAETEAGDLEAAMAAVGMADVNPQVDTAAIDRALEKARMLLSALRQTETVGGKGAGGGDPVKGARAKGGPVSRGGVYLVGEDGPEVMTASRSGYVHPTGEGVKGQIAETAERVMPIKIGSISIAPNLSFPNVAPADAESVAKVVMARIREELGSALRGVMADVGMGA